MPLTRNFVSDDHFGSVLVYTPEEKSSGPATPGLNI